MGRGIEKALLGPYVLTIVTGLISIWDSAPRPLTVEILKTEYPSQDLAGTCVHIDCKPYKRFIDMIKLYRRLCPYSSR